MLCYVVGSRRLMPPDALQPKAYCTNPGLWSFLLGTPGVCTRYSSSERELLWREMVGNFDRNLRLPRLQFRVLLHAANMRHGTNGFTSLPKEGLLMFFFLVLKNPTASAGFEPASLGTKGQHATSRPPKPLRQVHSGTGRIMSMKNYNNTIGNRNRDLPARSAVPQPTAPLCTVPKFMFYVKLCVSLSFCLFR